MLVGYARVSTADQRLDLQLDALERANCEKVFTDVLSGAKADRPGLREALSWVREGDSIVVYRLDRLGRSLKDFLEVLEDLLKHGVNVRSIQEGIDTATPFGEAMAKVIVVFAEMERSWIRERTKSGLQAAKARGKLGGRARKMTPEQEEMARTLEANNVPVVQICQTLGISRATFYRRIAPKKQEKPVSD